MENKLNKKVACLFVKGGGHIFHVNEISNIDCTNIENLIVIVELKSGKSVVVKELEALELVMQVKPNVVEGKRLLWPKFVWNFHNFVGHPVMAILAFFKLYKLAFWVHDVTVPKPIGKKIATHSKNQE